MIQGVTTTVYAAPEKAHSAFYFVDTIGVNTHLYYHGSVYVTRYNDIIKPKLLDLGVRHIRDGGSRNLDGYLDKLKDLRSNGIYANLSFDPRNITPQAAVSLIKELGNVVDAAEGPNEYEKSGDRNWVNTLHNYMQQLYQGIKSDPATKKVRVFGPSLTSESAYSKVGDLSAFVDNPVMHNYYSGHNPGTPGWGENGYGSIPWNLRVTQMYSGSKPVIATETGYHNAIGTANSHRGIPEDVAAKYIPRLYLEHFNAGIRRTFAYELIENCENPNEMECNFGLLRNDGSEKPAFVALRNLIGLLKDSNTKFTRGSLDYSLSGDTTDVHHTLLQKHDGRFYLILWQEVSSFDVNSLQQGDIPKKQVTLTLNTPISKATTYEPNNSNNPISHLTHPKNIGLSVPDYPLVIELTKEGSR